MLLNRFKLQQHVRIPYNLLNLNLNIYYSLLILTDYNEEYISEYI